MLGSLRRRIRILTLLTAAWWVWKERFVLAGMLGFASTVPDRVRLGRTGEVALAARVNLALLREPRLKGADVRLGAVQGGDVCLEVGAGSEAAGLVARQVVERLHGIDSVRIEDATAKPATAATPTVVAGSGSVESPSGDEAPVRI
jgi:hypothetical protein